MFAAPQNYGNGRGRKKPDPAGRQTSPMSVAPMPAPPDPDGGMGGDIATPRGGELKPIEANFHPPNGNTGITGGLGGTVYSGGVHTPGPVLDAQAPRPSAMMPGLEANPLMEQLQRLLRIFGGHR